MFLCTIGAAYLKITFILNEINTEFYQKYIEDNKKELVYIETKLTQSINKSVYLFFKINLMKVKEFISSLDYKFIKLITEKEILKEIDVSGRLTTKIEKLLIDLFNLSLNKKIQSTKSAIVGIDYLNTNIEYPFFYLQDQDILNLFKVGHQISQVTDQINLNKKDNLYPYLLVNAAEGVSVYRVNSKDDFVRIGGNLLEIGRAHV